MLIHQTQDIILGDILILLILLSVPGMLVYWVARTVRLLRGGEDEINHVLDIDVWWARRIWRFFVEPSEQSKWTV